jgi:hypothetical protein
VPITNTRKGSSVHVAKMKAPEMNCIIFENTKGFSMPFEDTIY